ncbi:MAG: TIGR02556 family CRISPR-associated protein [bacterium]
MIESLKTIGEYAIEQSNDNLLTQLVDNPNSNGQYEKVLIILFEKKENEVKYKGIDLEEYTESKLDKYAYKYGSPRGGDLTPTSKITDLEKTYIRIQNPLKKLCSNFEGNTENEKIIMDIYNNFQNEEESDNILEDLKKTNENLDTNAILTIAIIYDDKKLYVGDFKEFTTSLLERYEKKFYFKSSYTKAEKESIGYNNKCYICSKKSEKTYGYVGTYSFYTLDKPGFTSGGFKRGESWKNYPVCPECAQTLDLGKEYIEAKLSSRFCGINYSIIPKTIFSTNDKSRDDIFRALEYLEEHKKMSLQKDTQNRLTDTQDELFDLMTDFDNYINFNLMFYEEQNSAFRILLYIEDVLPSYIKHIFEVKDKLDKVNLFTNLPGKEGKQFSLKFKFNLISDFFYVNQTNKPDFTKQFLEITHNIFSGQKISYHLLIDRFISHIRAKFRNGESIWFDNLKAIMILKFLNELKLLSEIGEEGINLTIEGQKKEYRKQLEDYINNHKDILNNNVKILAFLEGILAQKLINIQKNQTDGASSPFMARLNSLKINQKILMRIYSESINKLEEYDSNYYNQLEEMIADYVLVSDFDNISNNELSFYFVTGMNQAGKFKFSKKDEEDNVNDSAE